MNKQAAQQKNTSQAAPEQDTFKLREERLQKLQTLKDEFEIYPYLLHLEEKGISSLKGWNEFKTERKLGAIVKEEFDALENGEKSEALVWVAGRIHSNRNSGMFLDLYDDSGKIQAVVERDNLEDAESYKPKQEDGKHFLELL
ncbi:MAG TPA: OB-fold nucleic acid binding domain-containing protein, partial [Vampirovibrionales bacterium]